MLLFLLKNLLNTAGIKKTYIQVNKANTQVNSDRIAFFKNTFNLEVAEENKKFSEIFLTPKLNEYPYKARFIIAALECSSKALSKAVTAALKLMCKHIETYNSKSHYFSEAKSFWLVENKQRAIDTIKKHNIRDKARSITTYDFSILSASITLIKLKNMIRELTVSVLKVIYNSLLL